jgi:hypothetical protein
MMDKINNTTDQISGELRQNLIDSVLINNTAKYIEHVNNGTQIPKETREYLLADMVEKNMEYIQSESNVDFKENTASASSIMKRSLDNTIYENKNDIFNETDQFDRMMKSVVEKQKKLLDASLRDTVIQQEEYRKFFGNN